MLAIKAHWHSRCISSNNMYLYFKITMLAVSTWMSQDICTAEEAKKIVPRSTLEITDLTDFPIESSHFICLPAVVGTDYQVLKYLISRCSVVRQLTSYCCMWRELSLSWVTAIATGDDHSWTWALSVIEILICEQLKIKLCIKRQLSSS